MKAFEKCVVVLLGISLFFGMKRVQLKSDLIEVFMQEGQETQNSSIKKKDRKILPFADVKRFGSISNNNGLSTAPNFLE